MITSRWLTTTIAIGYAENHATHEKRVFSATHLS